MLASIQLPQTLRIAQRVARPAVRLAAPATAAALLLAPVLAQPSSELTGTWFSVAQAAPVEASKKVTEPQWRKWVWGHVAAHRQAAEGNTVIVSYTVRTHDGYREQVDAQYSPSTGALVLSLRSTQKIEGFTSREYGYDIICSTFDQCSYKNSSDLGKWVNIPAGRLSVEGWIVGPNDLTSRLVTRNVISGSTGERRGLGSTSRYPTDATKETLTVEPGGYTYLGEEKLLVAKGRAASWTKTSMTTRVGPPSAQFTPTAPDQDPEVDSPWGSRTFRFPLL